MSQVALTVNVTTTGSAGSATGSATTPPIWGYLYKVKVDYHASAPATTTVDVDEANGSARKVIDLAGANTDVTFHPRLEVQDKTGADASAFEQFWFQGEKLTVAVAASDALTNAVIVTLYIDGRVGSS